MRGYYKISDEMGEKLGTYARQFGMSKSSFVAYAIGAHIRNLEYQAEAFNAVNGKLSTIMDEMSNGGKNHEVQEAFSLPQKK